MTYPTGVTPVDPLPTHSRALLSRSSPGFLVSVLLIQLIALLTLWVAWEWQWPGFDHTHLQPVMYEVMPLVVPLFGALGGVTNGMWSVTKYWSRYDSDNPTIRATERRTWAAWTVMQLPIGAVFGVVAVIIVVLVTKTITPTDDPGSADISATGMGVLAAVAFTVGFRQRTFQDLLTRVTDILLGPGDATDHTSFSVEPTSMTFMATANAPATPQKVTVTNLGTRRLVITASAIRLEQDAPAAFAFSPPANIESGADGEIEVRFDPDPNLPQPTGGWTGRLLVSFGSITRSVELTGTRQ